MTNTNVDNPKAWLVAATCDASRHYWRTCGRWDVENVPPKDESLAGN